MARDPKISAEDLNAQLDGLTDELQRRREERRREAERP